MLSGKVTVGVVVEIVVVLGTVVAAVDVVAVTAVGTMNEIYILVCLETFLI